MAEGAIEGTASDYEVASAHATEFAFSRFDAPKGDPLSATGAVSTNLVDASAIERLSPLADAADAARSRRLQEVVDAGSTGSARGWPIAGQSRRLSETSTSTQTNKPA